MRKNFSNLASLVAAVVFICGGFVCTSCSEQQAIAPEPEKVYTPGPTQYIDRTIKQIIDNILIGRTNKTNVELLYNGKLVRRASVSPDSRILYLPADQQVEPTLEYKGDGRWIDSNGMGFTATEENFPEDSLNLTSAVTAEKKMDLFRIHEKVAQISANFVDEGMATDLQSGKPGTYSLPMPNADYFVSDSSVTVRIEKETEIQIEWRDSIVVKDSIVYVDKVEYVTINREKNLAIVNGFGYGELRFFRDGKTFVFRMDLDKTSILREESAWGLADKLSESLNGFELTDGQIGRYTVTKNGVNLESILLQGVTFQKLNDIFKYGTVTTKVAFSYDEDGENVREEYEVSASYFHELEAKAEPEVVTPEITTEYTYTVDSTRTAVKDSEGNLTGQKVRITVKRNEDGKTWKIQYLAWETGLLSPTITGTQVGGNSMLRATTWSDPEYVADGWSGTDTSRAGFKVVSTSKEYKFRTPFPKVPGFGGSEESVAESNIVFGTRTCTFTDPENTSYTFTISADGVNSNETSVKVIQDEVGTDEAAKAEVNGRGLEYTYCGTHYLSVEQYVGKTLVLTQTRAEQLLSPKN